MVQVHFAAYLDTLRTRRAQAQGQAGDSLEIGGNVLTDHAVAACRAGFELAVLIRQRNGQAVNFQLGDILDCRVRRQPQMPLDFLIEPAQLVIVECIRQRQHRLPVRVRLEIRLRRRPHPLGRRVGGDDLRVRRFQVNQLAQKMIVFCVRHLRLV